MPAVLALPDIGLLLAGLLLSVLAFALFALRDLLTGALSNVPLVGGWMSSSLGGMLDSARNAVVDAAHTSFSGAERLFKWAAGWMGHVLTGIGHTLAEYARTIEHIATVQVPRLFDLARHEAAVLFDRLRHDAARWVAVARHETAVLFDGLRHDTLTWVNDVRLYVDRKAAAVAAEATGLFRTAEADIASARADARAFAIAETSALAAAVAVDLSTLQAQTADLFRTAEHDAAAGIAAAEAAASSALAAGLKVTVTDIDTWGSQALQEAWPDASGDIDALRQVLGDAFPDVSSLLQYLAGAGAAGLLGALIRSLAGTAALTRLASDCIVPNCENLSQLGKDLSELGSAVSAAAILGWLVFIATDPVAAADDTVTVADPFVQAVFGPLTDLLSAGIEHL